MTNDDRKPFDPTDSNPDPITHEPGAHPVGTGLGAAYTGAIGTAIGGAFGGPVGAVVGAAIGAVSGGLLGKTAAESVNPTVEDEYWRSNYASRPYIESGYRYEDYQPAYRTGYEGYHRYADTGRTYEEIEPDLQRDYESHPSRPRLAWDQARYATRDAWSRVETSHRGEPIAPKAVDPDRVVIEDRVHQERLETHPERQQMVERRLDDSRKLD